MSYDHIAEVREVYDEKPKAAPIGRETQELGMQIDRIEKTIEGLQQRLEPILAPERPRETQNNVPHETVSTSELAHRLSQINMRLSRSARLLDDIHSRIEL